MNKNPPLFIKDISQKDNESFMIEWNDGIIQLFHLETLQQHCPCANCTEGNGKLKSSLHNVRANQINSVGRYAIKIEYTQGCSKGIYSFSYLRELGKMESGR